MGLDDLILISVDDHIIEPPNLFDAHIPAKYRDRCPRMVTDDNIGTRRDCRNRQHPLVRRHNSRRMHDALVQRDDQQVGSTAGGDDIFRELR